MTVLDFIVLSLATWRLTSLLVYESGPFEMFDKIRHIVGVRYDEYSIRVCNNVFAEALSCVMCASFWVGLALLVLYLVNKDVATLVSAPFAISALAIMADSVINNVSVGGNDG